MWDSYIPDSLKESTRDKRGKSIRRKVLVLLNSLPAGWTSCVITKIKKNCFHFTHRELSWILFYHKNINVISGASVAFTGEKIGHMSVCNLEVADTKIAVHIMDAFEQGMEIVKVRTVDTDVVTILVGAFFKLAMIQPQVDIWVAFGMGKSFHFYSINAICASLGEAKSRALPVFHALTGCDTVSAFMG